MTNENPNEFFRETHQRLFTQNGGACTVGNLSSVGHHQTGKSIIISYRQINIFVVVEFEFGFIIAKMLIHICEDFFIDPFPKM
jgi:hypothetical protein